MKSKLWLALMPAVCLCWLIRPTHAQQALDAGSTRSVKTAAALSQSTPSEEGIAVATSRIVGVLKDPSGAVVPGGKIEVRNLASGIKRSSVTDRQGGFLFDKVPVGRYQVTADAAGFETAVIDNIPVTGGTETIANLTLRIARSKTVVEVTEPAFGAGAAAPHKVGVSDRMQSRSTAQILEDMPGVTLRENGQLASIPILHGLGDERTKLVVDGMTISPACPNHMNPPLSYIAPNDATEVTVMAGITPVSMGGDSLGGTISVESRLPVFAKAGEGTHSESISSGFFRSNGESYGGSFSEWVAGRNLSLGYNGSWAAADDYTDGNGHKVTSTDTQSTGHTVTLAGQRARNLFVLQAGLHHTPYEGFVNAQMDLVRNYAESLNLHYRREFGRGVLDAHLYWQGTWHAMNIGGDKSTFPMPMWMPMNTHGRDLGYAVKVDLPLFGRQTLQVGNELHRFVIDDTWPAVPGEAPMMGPNTFVSVNDGRRVRLGTFVEVASKWNSQWTTLFGLRNDTVWTNAGPVQGYSNMVYGADADTFNELNRAKVDVDLDATGVGRYAPNASSSYEFGYGRKTRAPNLYERYAWSTNWMASGMIGWFGDGNYYVGNVDLKPEIAHTVSATASWHDRARKEWEIRLTPYLTYIKDYVDVDTQATKTYGACTFAQLRFGNLKARISGADLSGSGTIWHGDRFGTGKIDAVAGWLRGERLDTATGLYQMMPLNVRLALDEELRRWTAGFAVQGVGRKSKVDPHRYEQVTPGYAILNAHSGYQRGHLSIGVAADNLFNKSYELPLGGVNFDDFMANGRAGQIKPLTGRGRSLYAGLTAQF
jgi:iron complex outermembrane receptor protein